MTNTEHVDRLIEDFKHGKKLGVTSTARLLDVMRSMAYTIDVLKEDKRREFLQTQSRCDDTY